MKTCSRCKLKLDDSAFRLRRETRGKRGGGKLVYLNNTCKKCDAEISNKTYFKNKDDEKFILAWRKKSNDYYWSHREEIKIKQKIKRQTPEYKAMMRAYREKNKDKINSDNRVRNKKYVRGLTESVAPAYINRLKSTAHHHIKSKKSRLKSAKILHDSIEEAQVSVIINRIRRKIKQKKK